MQVEHPASHVLGRLARRVSVDWEQLHGHPVHYLESFVEPDRHAGTCYHQETRFGRITDGGHASMERGWTYLIEGCLKACAEGTEPPAWKG